MKEIFVQIIADAYCHCDRFSHIEKAVINLTKEDVRDIINFREKTAALFAGFGGVQGVVLGSNVDFINTENNPYPALFKKCTAFFANFGSEILDISSSYLIEAENPKTIMSENNLQWIGEIGDTHIEIETAEMPFTDFMKLVNRQK